MSQLQNDVITSNKVHRGLCIGLSSLKILFRKLSTTLKQKFQNLLFLLLLFNAGAVYIRRKAVKICLQKKNYKNKDCLKKIKYNIG